MHRKGLFLAILVLVVGLLYLVLPRGERPNVVIISIDSLRADHLGCYGYKRPTSPCLDRLAGEGALFTRASSSTSWTLPAHAALFTGLPDSVHGCRDANYWLARSRETVAERFREAGYATAGFYAGPFLHPYFGLAQGFQTYHDCTSYSAESIKTFKGEEKAAAALLDRSHKDITGPITLREVGRWLREHPTGPRFLFIHLWDVHLDYIPPKPYDTMFTDPDYRGRIDGRGLEQAIIKTPTDWSERDLEHLQALYDGEIRWTDNNLEKLLALLAAHGMGENTILIVTADHGEAFFEHGRFGHAVSLHREETHIPLIVHAPGRVPAGRRIDALAQIIDIAPTALALAGVEPLARAMGRDLAPLWLGATPADWHARPAVAELYRNDALAQFSMEQPGWKHIRDFRSDRTLLYDLTRDPTELMPLIGPKAPLTPAQVGSLEREIAQTFLEAAARLPLLDKENRDTPDIPKMTIQQLRALGYLK